MLFAVLSTGDCMIVVVGLGGGSEARPLLFVDWHYTSESAKSLDSVNQFPPIKTYPEHLWQVRNK